MTQLLNITKKLGKKQAVSHIERYKYLKNNKLIDWTVKGKRSDKGLSTYQKRKIRESYNVAKSIGPATAIFKPRKKGGESKLAYKRRVNKMQRDAGIGVSPLSGVIFSQKRTQDMKIKDGKIILENKKHKYSAEFVGFDIIQLNKDGWQDYLWILLKSQNIKDNDIVSVINERNTGQGVSGHFLDDFVDNIIIKIKEYKARGLDISFITGILIERELKI